MDDKSKKILAEFLQNHNQDMWNNSAEELKTGLGVE